MALILSRQVDETVVIGPCVAGAFVEVTVGEIRDGNVRLLFTAPREVEIHRKEIADRIAIKKLAQGAEPCQT